MITALATTPTTAQTQQELRLLLVEDKLEKTINRLLSFSETQNLPEIHDLTLQQAAKHKEYENHQLANTLSFEQLGVMKSQVIASVIGLINRLSEQEETVQQLEVPPKSVKESKLKTHILILLIFSKTVISLWLFNQWQAGGFTADQFTGTLSLLIPVLASYSILAVRDLFRAREKEEQPKYFPRKTLLWSYLFILAYMLLLLFATGLKPQGQLNYSQMNSLIVVFESGFGVLVGQLVMDIFKKE